MKWLLMFFALPLSAAIVELGWKAPADPVTGYCIYSSQTRGVYTNCVTVGTNWAVVTVPAGTNYFVVTAIFGHLESEHSNEVSDIPTTPATEIVHLVVIVSENPAGPWRTHRTIVETNTFAPNGRYYRLEIHKP